MSLATVSRQLAVAATAILAGTGAWVAAARASPAGGGDTIAHAPDLPLGRPIASNWNRSHQAANGRYGEFWRVRLGAGDQLIVDWALTKSACSGAGRGIVVYSPSVTDGSLARASVAVDRRTQDVGKHEFVWVAPSAGRWPLFFYGCNKTSYAATAWVQRFTRTRVTAPPPVVRSRPFTIKGTVRGTSDGKVAVEVRGPGSSTSLPLVASISRSGKFAARIRVHRAGTYTLRVTYYGDSSHRASTATVKIHAG